MLLQKNYLLREYKEDDSENVLHFVSELLVNEFRITLDFDNLDSDLLDIKNRYNKNDRGCFWVVEQSDNYQIIGTVAIRKLNIKPLFLIMIILPPPLMLLLN